MLVTMKNKFTASLLFILVLAGGGALWVGQQGMRLYHEELTQSLNQNIAMYITEEHKLLSNPDNSEAVIQQLAHQAMIINPTTEVYLLDRSGKVIAHALTDKTLQYPSVDLEPVHQFLSGDGGFPLRGTNPRTGKQTIFSVSEVRSAEGLQGYLYVILEGEVFDQLQSRIGWSHISQQTFWTVSLILLCALLIGGVVFHRLSRPLGKLACKMDRFFREQLGSSLATDDYCQKDMNEVIQLEKVFNAMSSQIGQQLEQLRESDRLRRELISNISHDLRTPLTTIQSYLETLLIKESHVSEEDRIAYLEAALKSCQRLSCLIADLFELSKLESGYTQPVFENFSLAELLQDTVQEFQLEADKKSITLMLQTPESNTQVYADIGLIQRVLDNLIRNAIHHTPCGGCIELSFSSASSSVQVQVADNGQGINSDDLPHIFDRFYQSSTEAKQGSNSSGLGLAIVKRILDLHDCRIQVSSQLNQGTRFQFDLPLDISPLQFGQQLA